jgi:predicted ATP-grasp superfamily ATP-dependent carboligase
MSDRDKVLIFGIDSPIGLVLVRELGKYGVEVYGIGQSPRAIGLYSRFLKQGYIFSGPHQAIIPFVKEIAGKHRISCLMTVAESNILLFNQHRLELRELKFLFAHETAMSIVLDKEKTYTVAREIGIETPLSFSLQTIEELDKISSQICYPVILKWSNPLDIGSLLSQNNIALLKAQYCYNLDELHHNLARYLPTGRFPLIQSFCPGYGLGHMIFMYNKEPLLVFQHRRLHEWPPEGGVSSLCESIAITENKPLLEKSVELLCRISWEGPAMVEYRFDPVHQKAVLMEINGRFWGSLPLAYHAHAPFAWYTYSVLGKGIIPSCQPYRVGIRCMYMAPELKRLATILFHPSFIQNKDLHFNKFREFMSLCGNFFNPKQSYYIFSLKDPWPALMDGYYIVRKSLSALGTRFFYKP